jgi:hypothetical protein
VDAEVDAFSEEAAKEHVRKRGRRFLHGPAAAAHDAERSRSAWLERRRWLRMPVHACRAPQTSDRLRRLTFRSDFSASFDPLAGPDWYRPVDGAAPPELICLPPDAAIRRSTVSRQLPERRPRGPP